LLETSIKCNSDFISNFFPRKYTVIHLFLIKYIKNFEDNSKIFAIFFAPFMVIDSHQKRFVINMQLRQCLARAKPFRLKKIKKRILTGIFDFQKNPSASKKSWISKFGFKNVKLATLHATSDYMRPLVLSRGNCCVTRPGIGPPWLCEEIHTVRFVVCLQFLAYYLILLDLQLNNFPRACTISREAPSKTRFQHFLQPCWRKSTTHWLGHLNKAECYNMFIS